MAITRILRSSRRMENLNARSCDGVLVPVFGGCVDCVEHGGPA
jgi:hypothetical protein